MIKKVKEIRCNNCMTVYEEMEDKNIVTCIKCNSDAYLMEDFMPDKKVKHMETLEIKIKTPYGDKNWSFVKKCFDNHERLLEACKKALKKLEN